MTVPLMIVRRLERRSAHVDPGHLPERFGPFVIVAPGESVVALNAVEWARVRRTSAATA